MSVKPKPVITTWDWRETEILIREVIARKAIIYGCISSTLTKKDKLDEWERILGTICREFPDGDVKTVVQVKKKWDNTMKDARIECSKYITSLAVVGGPPHIWKNQIFKTIFENFLSRDNYTANISQSSIEDGVSSETGNITPVSNIPSTEALTCSTAPEMFNYSLDAHELQRIQIEMKREQSDDEAEEQKDTTQTSNTHSAVPNLMISSSVDAVPVNQPSQSLRQTQNRTKRSLCETSMTSLNKRAMRDRLDLIHSMMVLRRELGDPVRISELPDDVIDAISNIKQQ